MTFPLDHWRDPRATIATRYQKSDIDYITHGGLVAMEVVRGLQIPPDRAGRMTLLDFGCGTGRISRILAGYFGKVIAYDPVQECIEVGKKECSVPIPNIEYCTQLPDVKFDAVVAINVFEHLEHKEQIVAMESILGVINPKAPIMLWYNVMHNRDVLSAYFGVDFIKEDDAQIAKNGSYFINVRIFAR